MRICVNCRLKFFPFFAENSTWKMPRTGAHKKCLMKLWDLKDFERDAEERVAFFDACIVGYIFFSGKKIVHLIGKLAKKKVCIALRFIVTHFT